MYKELHIDGGLKVNFQRYNEISNSPDNPERVINFNSQGK